jgi:hypothetical protein
MPGSGVALVEGDDVEGGVDVDVDVEGSTVSVVVLTDGGGAASVGCDGASLSRFPFSSCPARTTATPNNIIVATTRATWVRPKRDLRGGAPGGGASTGGYGV